ncbi:MAG: PQQ-dependent sugar dehydrogenase [Cyanobacteriota bacterium]
MLKQTSLNTIFQLDSSSQSVSLEFTIAESEADFVNEVGVFRVDDELGTIDGIAPGTPEYLFAALGQGQVIFSALSSPGFSNLVSKRQLSFDSNTRLGFYLVSNNTTDKVLADLAAGRTPANVFFAHANANTNGFNYSRILELSDSTLTLAWEDQLGGGDQDFDDSLLKVQVINTPPPSETALQGKLELIDLREQSGLIPVTSTVHREATFNNSFGFYQIDDPTGSIGNLNPGDAGYAEAAIRNRVDFSNGFSGGVLLAPFFIGNSTPETFLAQNPSNQAGQGPLTYFAFLNANPDGIDHIRLLGDNTFAFEDLYGGGDFDYNDLVIQLSFTPSGGNQPNPTPGGGNQPADSFPGGGQPADSFPGGNQPGDDPNSNPNPNPIPNTSEIQGTAWNDINGNGVQDSSETGLAGWTVFLDQNQNGQLEAGEVFTTTDANGNYIFTTLTAGTYTVAGVLPTDWQSTFPVPSPHTVNLNAGENATEINFGNRSDLPQVQLTLTPLVTGLENPVAITHAGDASDRIFVVEQEGRIQIIQNGNLLATPFLDISDRISTGGERGLLGLAFPPDYASKGYFYVNYTNPAGDTVVARYRLTNDPNVAALDSEEIILTVDQPFENHNGGQLAFGPDGYLYIGMGDGGGGGDPQNNAQNPQSLLGKILRIDVESGAATYTIPDTNPFVAANDPNNQFSDEIWALGLRNPWRFSFDRITGDLYIGDVGQNALEEIDFQPATSQGGENYGWNIMEGSSRYNNNPSDLTGLVLPVAEYDHSLGQSVTGGMVYRGSFEPSLQGVYLYGDFISGRIWGLRPNSTGWDNTLLLDSPYGISTFGEDQAGNLYVADYFNGGIYSVSV